MGTTYADQVALSKKLGYNYGDYKTINDQVLNAALANPKLFPISNTDLFSLWQSGNHDSRIVSILTGLMAPPSAAGDAKAMPENTAKMIDSLEKKLNKPNLSQTDRDATMAQIEVLSQVYQKQGGELKDYLNKYATQTMVSPTSTAKDQLNALLQMNKASSYGAPYLNDVNARKEIDAYIKSLEDPFKANTEAVMASMAQRGLVGSGIQNKNIGKLQSAYDQAKSAKAGDLGTDKANAAISLADQDYQNKINQLQSTLQAQLDASGKTAQQFYSENQALIDAKMSQFASDRNSAYQDAVTNYNTTSNDYWNNLKSTGDIMSSIGGVASDLYSQSQKSNTSPSTYDYSTYNKAINSLDQYKNFDPWANYNTVPNYGSTIRR